MFGQDTETLLAVLDLADRETDDSVELDNENSNEERVEPMSEENTNPEGTQPDGEDNSPSVLSLLEQIKTKLSKDDSLAELSEPLLAAEKAIKDQQAEFAQQMEEVKTKLTAVESERENAKAEFTKQQEKLESLLQAARDAKRAADINDIAIQLGEFAHDPQIAVFKKYAAVPTTSEECAKFTEEIEENGEKKSVETSRSTLEALLEFAMACPEGARPKAINEPVSSRHGDKNESTEDTERMKIRLAAFSSALKRRELKQEDYDAEMARYKANLEAAVDNGDAIVVSPN